MMDILEKAAHALAQELTTEECDELLERLDNSELALDGMTIHLTKLTSGGGK